MLKQIIDNNIKVVDFSNEGGIIEKLEELKVKLCKSEKPLNEYLDSKRKSFPRFFFISSTDLIDILSNGNNFKLVNTHVQKIFLSIRKFVTKNEQLTDNEIQNEVKLNNQETITEEKNKNANENSNEIETNKYNKKEELTNNRDGDDDDNIKNDKDEKDEKEETIIKLISSYGEEICNFHEGLVLKGKVECYLNDIIDHIKYTLKYYITNLFRLKDLFNNEKEKWIDEKQFCKVT